MTSREQIQSRRIAATKWLEHIQRGTLETALDANPSAARKFFGMMPFMRRDSFELSQIAVARYWLSLTREQLASEIVQNDKKTRAALNVLGTTFRIGSKMTKSELNRLVVEVRQQALRRVTS